MEYPDRHHPCYFLESALLELGAQAQVVRDERTEGCWGLLVNGKPMVWLIDNRWQHERVLEDPAAERLLKRGALVCCAQQPDAVRVGGKYLPLATTPGYRLIKNEKLFDVGFVGTVRDATRASILIDIASRYTLSMAEGVFGDAAVETYCGARCAVNIPTNYYDENAYDINMRVFEILATGTPLLTNRLSELEALGIKHNVNALFYDDVEHLLRLISTVLLPGRRYEQMAMAGAALAAERHTYRHRAEQVLQWLA